MNSFDKKKIEQLHAQVSVFGKSKKKIEAPVKKNLSLSEQVAKLGKPRPPQIIEKKVYLGKTGQKGEKGDQGEKGDRGEPGRNGRDGRDGLNASGYIPETVESIVDKLNSKEGILSIKVFKDFPAPTVMETFDFKSLKFGGKNQLELRDIKGARLDNNDQRWHGGGDVVAAGTNIIITTNASGQKVINASATSVSFVDNEIVSGSGTAFVLANTPILGSEHIFAGRQRLYPTTDYSISGTGITTVLSWSTGDLLADYRK